MSRTYLVTEGETDVAILKRVLPERIVETIQFVPAGGGIDTARSLARSLLASRQRPVALVVDADTSDQLAVQERVDFLDYYMRQGAGPTPFKVFVAVPELDFCHFRGKSSRELILANSSV
jgi:hypothetical protein